MKAFVLKDGPFLKSKTKASQLKLTILVALIPLVLFAWVKNGIYPYLHHNMTFQQMCTPITMIGIVVLISTLSYYLTQKLKEEKMNHYKWLDILCSSLILVLLLPIRTPIYLLVIGGIAMAILESCEPLKKYVNPIIIVALLILIGNTITNHNIYYNVYEQEIFSNQPSYQMITDGTLSSYQMLVQPYGRLLDFFLGSVPGGLGVTSSCLLLIVFLYLCYKKAIKWEITITYFFTVFGMSTFIGLFSHLGYWYPIYQIMSGGLLFGAIFLATDSLSTPTTPLGRILYGFGLGILTIFFRYFIGTSGSVILSIFIMSLFTTLLDHIGAVARFHFEKSIPIFLLIWICILTLGIFIGTRYQVEAKIDMYQKRESI